MIQGSLGELPDGTRTQSDPALEGQAVKHRWSLRQCLAFVFELKKRYQWGLLGYPQRPAVSSNLHKSAGTLGREKQSCNANPGSG